MSRKRLADLTEQIGSGVFKDLPNGQIPLWEDGNNIVFDPEGPRPIYGFSELFAKPAGLPVRGLIQAWIGGTKYVFFGNEKNLYRYNADSGNLSEVSKATDAYSDEFWTFMQWGDWILASNNAEPIQVYKGSSFGDLSTGTGGITTKIVQGFKAHAIAFATDAEGRKIQWSDEDDVENWSPAIDNAAGSLFIRDLDSPIRAAVSGQQGVLFYGDSTVHILRWTGPPFYFGADLLGTSIGALGPYAVVGVGNTQYGMNFNGIWVFVPGQEPQYIDTPAVRNYVFDNIDFDNAHKSIAWYDQEQRLVIFSYPVASKNTGEPELSVCFSLDTQKWCPLDFAASGASKTPAFRYTTAFDFRGTPYQHGVKGAGGGGSFDSQQFISFGDGLTFNNGYGISGYGVHGYGGS